MQVLWFYLVTDACIQHVKNLNSLKIKKAVPQKQIPFEIYLVQFEDSL